MPLRINRERLGGEKFPEEWVKSLVSVKPSLFGLRMSTLLLCRIFLFRFCYILVILQAVNICGFAQNQFRVSQIENPLKCLNAFDFFLKYNQKGLSQTAKTIKM